MAKKVEKTDVGAIGILTSGGDAPGMNSCLRGAVRFAVNCGLKIYAIHEGYQGMIENRITRLFWSDVGGIMSRGGTIIGTARSMAFKTEEGLMSAVENLVHAGIDKLVVIGGDGSLSGAEFLRKDWSSLQKKLVAAGRITKAEALRYPVLTIAGAVGSIDNDMAETDMTIGADSALHRIVSAVDMLLSTAYSHQRTFIIEVMGRNCGYLALMSALATGAACAFFPEAPPAETWKDDLVQLILAGKNAGRRDSIIIVAEGARDRHNNPITCEEIKQVLAERGNIEARITTLGHVQRGGVPSAFDRYMSTILGVAAVRSLLEKHSESKMVALHGNRVRLVSLTDAVAKTRSTAKLVEAGDYAKAADMRGEDWKRMVGIYRTLAMTLPSPHRKNIQRLRLGVITCGHAAPGMNSAVRTAVRIAMEHGAEIFGIEGGPEGLIGNKFHEFAWMDVENWNSFGGSLLGAGRRLPEEADYEKMARNLKKHKIDGLLVIGDWLGYKFMDSLIKHQPLFPAFRIPMIALPASINNDLPGSEYSIGSDTAINTITEAVDKIKDSTDTAKRTYVVEVMGRYSGYIAMMAGLSSGAEYIYLPETGITLDMLCHDVRELAAAFHYEDRHAGLIIRSEKANEIYTTDFIAALFEEAGGESFDVRKTILGPIQQGGIPTPYDRIEGVRLGHYGIKKLIELIERKSTDCSYVGHENASLKCWDWSELARCHAPDQPGQTERWWMPLKELATVLATRPKGRDI